MKYLKFDKETAEGLYRIFCGLGRGCYRNAEVFDEAKPNMEKAYEKVLDWGRKNCNDTRGILLHGKSNNMAVPFEDSKTFEERMNNTKKALDKLDINQIINNGNNKDHIEIVRELFAKLTDNERMEVLSDYCLFCGKNEKEEGKCYCSPFYDL